MSVRFDEILDLPSAGMVLGNDNANVKEAFWIVESVIEPKACKLRLSPLKPLPRRWRATTQVQDDFLVSN
jgi:hypothetical protein